MLGNSRICASAMECLQQSEVMIASAGLSIWDSLTSIAIRVFNGLASINYVKSTHII
jgi:hypothetical protein